MDNNKVSSVMQVKTKNHYSEGFITYNKTSFEYNHVTLPYVALESVVFSKSPLEENLVPKHVCLEKFPLKKLKTLQYYMIDILETQDLDPEERVWFNQHLNSVLMLLQGQGSQETSYFCNIDYLFRKINYRPIVAQLHVGRLYPSEKCSYVNLPREIRALLLENTNTYIDFDMVNAHPTLLLEYAIQEMQGYTPETLQSYVVNRDSTLVKVATTEQCSEKEAKRRMLITLNSTEKHAKFLGQHCLKLFHECSVIRDHVYKAVYYEGSSIYLYFKDSKDFHSKSLTEQKISVQSIYLQTKETDYVYSLIVFLRETIREYLEVKGITTSFKDTLTDKITNIDTLDYHLSCIPFFDGLYVGSEEPSLIQGIRQGVDVFNAILKEKGSFVVFKEKKIELESDKIDVKLFKAYSQITGYLHDLKPEELHLLLVWLDIKQIDFTNVNLNSYEEGLKGMLSVSREFRRLLFKRLMEESEDSSIALNSNFVTHLKNKYRQKLVKYKEYLKVEEETFETSFDADLHEDT